MQVLLSNRFFQRVQYMQDKTKRLLVNYMLHQVKSSAVRLTHRGFKDTLAKQEYADKPWIVFFYEFLDEKEESWALQTKLSAILVSITNMFFLLQALRCLIIISRRTAKKYSILLLKQKYCTHKIYTEN